MNINQINQYKIQANGNFGVLVESYLEYGIVRFQTCAATAKSIYFDAEGNRVYDENDIFNFEIGQLNVEQFKADLLDHQQGLTDFPTWLKLTAGSGIGYWIVDLEAKQCVYYDLDNNPVHTELIPGL